MPKGVQRRKPCSCQLRAFPHTFSTTEEWEQHDTELAAHRASLLAGETEVEPTLANVTEGVARLVLSDAEGHSLASPQRPDPSAVLGEVERSMHAIVTELLRDPGRERVSKQIARDEQYTDLLEAISLQIQTARTTIRTADQRLAAKLLWEKADLAKGELDGAALALQPLKDSPPRALVVDALRQLELELKTFTEKLPKDTRPLFYDSAYALQNPLANVDVMAQIVILLGLVCNVILGLSIGHTNFVFGSVTMLIKLAMSVHLEPGAHPPYDAEPGAHPPYDALQEDLLRDLPSNLRDAMNRMNLAGKTVLYAVCPSCHHIHAPTLSVSDKPTWPPKCENDVVGVDGRHLCETPLLVDTKGGQRPIRPFLSHSFLDYLARLLSDPEIENEVDRACDEALKWKATNVELVDNILHGTLIQGFQGPDGQLFIDRGKDNKMRLLFGFSLDFFPPRGSRRRSSSASIGVLTFYCLNLSVLTRQKPQHLYMQIITGPNAPHGAQLNPYLRPSIDIGVIGWERGIHLSQTGASPKTGRTLELAYVLSVNDLPAARDVCGAAQHNSYILCTRCDLRGRKNSYNTDCEQWTLRDLDHLRHQAERWWDADTLAERDEIYAADGQRWSEPFRLSYWDPRRMVTSEPMHANFEGATAFNTRFVLKLTAHDAKQKDEELPPAFEHEFLEWDPETMARDPPPQEDAPQAPGVDPRPPNVPAGCRPPNLKDVPYIHRHLLRPFIRPDRETEDEDEDEDEDADGGGGGGSDSDDGDEDTFKTAESTVPEFTEQHLRKSLMTRKKPSLMFVCWSLNLWAVAKGPVKSPAKKQGPGTPHEINLKSQKKAGLTELLVVWRLKKPHRDPNYIPRPKTITMANLLFVQRVIANTVTPAWVNHVPKNFGEKGAGSPKADEWRLMGTIYLPIASVIMWGEMTGPHADHFRERLEHSMALYQADTIVSRYTTSNARAEAYLGFMKHWVGNLQPLYPHTVTPRTRSNPHVALHVYDFLLLFGPALSWWAFPIEHLIGELGKINSNDRLGGQHEATIQSTWILSANIRRWINRPNCPAVISEFCRLFNFYLGLNFGDKTSQEKLNDGNTKSQPHETAHHEHMDVNYSRSSTHLGNSLIRYYKDGKVQVGSVEKIITGKYETKLSVRRQAPLPSGQHDPFLPFPHFPAKTYSSKMSEQVDEIDPELIIGHCARFDFSKDRAVIVDLSRVFFSLFVLNQG